MVFFSILNAGTCSKCSLIIVVSTQIQLLVNQCPFCSPSSGNKHIPQPQQTSEPLEAPLFDHPGHEHAPTPATVFLKFWQDFLQKRYFLRLLSRGTQEGIQTNFDVNVLQSTCVNDTDLQSNVGPQLPLKQLPRPRSYVCHCDNAHCCQLGCCRPAHPCRHTSHTFCN